MIKFFGGIVAMLITASSAQAQTGPFQFGVVNIGTTVASNPRIYPQGGSVSAADPTYAVSQWHPLSMTTAGRLRTDSIIQGLPGPTSDAAAAIGNPCYIVSAATTNSAVCKAAAGNWFGIAYITNESDEKAYLRLYNSATSPTCSSATDYVTSIVIPPSASVATDQVGGFSAIELIPTHFSAGVSYCITLGPEGTNNVPLTQTGIRGKLLVH